MGAFSRIRYVIAANVNSLIEKAEDPEKLLRALIREMEDASEDARLASADLLAEQKHLERVTIQIGKEIVEWQDRAEKAVQQDRDDLARTALKARAELETRLAAAQDEYRTLGERVKVLEKDMTTLKQKLGEARGKLREMTTRGQKPNPAAPIPEAKLSPTERRLRQAMGRFDRLQSQVERLEARVRSYEVGGPAPSPWTEPDMPADPAVEAELAKLKERVHGVEEPAPEPSPEPVIEETAEKTADENGEA